MGWQRLARDSLGLRVLLDFKNKRLRASSLGCIVFLLGSGSTAGAYSVDTAPSLQNVESSRAVVADQVVSLARRLDSLFGDEKAYDDYESSTLILEQDAYLRERSLGTGDFSIRLNLKLPNIQKKVDTVGETIVEVGKDVAEAARNKNSDTKKGKIVTTPKRKLANEESWKFSQQSGLSVGNPINYFFKVRARLNFKGRVFANSFSEEFGWSTTDKWVETTAFWNDYAIRDDVLFRIINEKNWYLNTGAIGTTHGFSIYRSISDLEALSINARMLTDNVDAEFKTSRYTIGLTHRRAINRDWVTLETTPQLVFLREKNFAGYWEVLFRLGFAIGRE